MGNQGRPVYGPMPPGSRTAWVPPRLLSALTSRVPLTILRGPRGYGKTTAIVHWLTTAADGVRTVYLPLDASAQRAEHFWTTLAGALTEAGIPVEEPATTGTPDEAVQRALLEHGEPLRLVIDNYHEAGHRDARLAVDEALLETLRASADLEIVALTRGLRTLETTGALSVDTFVLRPADLAMRPEDTVALAERYGVPMPPEVAEHLVFELGGWPAAVRACIAAAAVDGGSAHVDATAVDGYIDALLDDLRSSALREFLVRTAIPDEFSAGVVLQIVPERTGMRELRNLRVAGILQERATVDGLRYSYPPAIRDSLRRVARERYPESERDVHLTLMVLAAEDEGPVGVLRHALQAGEWEAALRIVEEDWPVLVTRYSRELAAAAANFPAELRDSEPRLRVLRDHLERLATPSGAARLNWRPTPAHFVDGAVRQRRGELAGATDDIHVLLQTGVAAVFAGENDAAAYAFERVMDHGVVHDERSARLLGMGGLLAAKTLFGQADLALDLLDDQELADVIAGGGDDEVGRLVAVGGRIMRAIASVDAMRPDVHEVMAQLREPARRDELWALAVNVRGLYASVYGSPADQARMVGHLRAALRHTQPGSIAESTLGTQLVELLVQGSQLDVAEQVLGRLPDTFVTGSTRAYLRHAQGKETEAIEAAERGLDDPRITQRSRVVSELLIASALFRLGQVTAAQRRFDRAVQVAYESGQRRPFMLISGEVFSALAGGDKELLGLRRQVPEAPPTTAAAKLSELSARELQVLTALHQHPGPAGVAESLGMSVNTAKTHLRHVYRKLGAAGRDEAVALSRGLLADRS